MAETTNTSVNTSTNISNLSNTSQTVGGLSLVAINPGTQLPLRLTSSNFIPYRAQLESLMIGYDLMGYFDGSTKAPPKTLNDQPNPLYTHWYRQDKLLLHAIFGSVDVRVMPLIATTSTTYEAWLKIKRLYANRSRSRVMQLKEDMALLQRGSKSVSEYLNEIQVKVDELAVIDVPLSDDDVTLHVLNGLGPEYRDIIGSDTIKEFR